MSHDHTPAPLHDVEDRADDARVLAQQVRPRSERKDGVERRQPPVLPRHVVRGRRDGSERGAANDQLGAAEARQVRQIRVAPGKLRDLHRAREVETRNG